MKVKEFLKKYETSSNVDVFIENKTGDMLELDKTNIENLQPDYIMDMNVKSFEIIDSVLCIYVKG